MPAENILVELKRRQSVHAMILEAKGNDHSTELTRLYAKLKELNNKSTNNLLDFILNSFDFNVLEDIYKIILKQSFGVFPAGNISEKEGVCFFTSLAARPHVPAEAEIPFKEYFQKHDEYFGIKVSEVVSDFKTSTIPLHHVVWMLSKNKDITWIDLRNFEKKKKELIFLKFTEQLKNSLNFLEQFGDTRIAIAVGHNGAENKLANCQSLSTVHVHTYVATHSIKNTEMIVPSDSQKSMYLNAYLVLVGILKEEVVELIKMNFYSTENDLEVVVTENPNDLFNQIRFDLTFKNPKKIEDVLVQVSEFEKQLGIIWELAQNVTSIESAKINSIIKNFVMKVLAHIKSPNILKDIPGVPGFVVVLKLNEKNEVVGIEIAPAKHGPAERQLGTTIKL